MTRRPLAHLGPDSGGEYMATKHPTMFVRLVALLIPRHFEVEPKNPYADLTEEQIEQRLRELSAQFAE